MTDERYVVVHYRNLASAFACEVKMEWHADMLKRYDYVARGHPVAAGTREACEAAKRLMEMP